MKRFVALGLASSLALGLAACGDAGGGNQIVPNPEGAGPDPEAAEPEGGGEPDGVEPDGAQPDGADPEPDSGCDDECSTVGARQCDGDGFQTCGSGADGCLDWSATTACGAGETCSNGQCALGCKDECTTIGAKQCGEKGPQTCGNHDEDACLEFSAPVACPDGQTCSQGSCSIECKNECTTKGAKQCAANGSQECGAFDDDECLEWGDVVPCPEGETCSSGACAVGCTSECTTAGAKQCSGNATQECGDFDDDACLEWGTATPCGDGQSCSGGQCAVGCKDECTTKGAKQCQGAGFQACGNFDADDCLEWGSVQPCGDGESCSGGQCAVGCTDECTTQGAKQCSGAGTQECGAWDADACLEWGTVVPCGDGETCSAGACAVGCEDECTTLGAKKCQGDGVQSCGNFDGDACLEWGTAVACPQGKTCSSGACSETCTEECTAIGLKKCEGQSVQTCGESDGDACLEWGTPVPCGDGQVCNPGGLCAVTCKDECTVQGATTCEGAGVKACGDYDGDGCLQWGSIEPCGPAETCSAGHCATTCLDECDLDGDTACGAFGVLTCGQHDGDGCLEWGSEAICDAGESCSNGVCLPIDECQDECNFAGESFCDEFGVLECGDFDQDLCLEWGTFFYCALGEACVDGSCVPQSGEGSCLEVNDCINACAPEDGVCASACFNEGTFEAQGEILGLYDCASYHGCVESYCLSVYCEDSMAACIYPTTGFGTCADVYSCAVGCGDDGFCQDACAESGALASQGDWLTLVVCLQTVCPDGDALCYEDAVATAGPCGAPNFQCLDPYAPDGLTCYSLIDCLSLCGEDTACQDECLVSASDLGEAEYNAVLGCVTDAGCFNEEGALDAYCMATFCGYPYAECWSFFDGAGTCPAIGECVDTCAEGSLDCISICLDAGSHVAQQAYLGLLLCLYEFCPAGDEQCYVDAQQGICADFVSLCEFN